MAPETPNQSVLSSAPNISSSDSDSGCALEEYLDLKPDSSSLGYTLPNSSREELKFIRTLLQLLPPQDCDERFCATLGELEKRELQKFSAHRRAHSMRHGTVVHVTADTSDNSCMRCGGKILVGDTAVCTERLQEENLRWHLKCFVCETCHLPLSQFIYFLQDNRIYCGRHHAELTRARCAACDQLIMSERCTKAEGLCWHVEHFCCWECEIALGGSRYVMRCGRPFCSGCFQRLHAESCEACGEPVDLDGELVTIKGHYWHKLPSCFCCTSCRTPLHRLEYMIHDDHLYCSQLCVSAGPGMCFSSNYHNNIGPSTVNHNPYIQCTTWNRKTASSNTKQIKSMPHDTCSFTSCKEVQSRLYIDTRRESSTPWLAEQRLIMEEEEDTSLSSSDSEPEGFFFGRPIPYYSPNRGTISPVHGKSTSTKKRQRGKSCKVS
ncbi:prickle-like protein 4 [Leptodactylus fuscus]|uniref:prickle-like protein 4 n=1 Tax=Leptodactylus fuscus TaxID=238119 RepID=UPI003F4F1649